VRPHKVNDIAHDPSKPTDFAPGVGDHLFLSAIGRTST
jgi:hypothetical protein